MWCHLESHLFTEIKNLTLPTLITIILTLCLEIFFETFENKNFNLMQQPLFPYQQDFEAFPSAFCENHHIFDFLPQKHFETPSDILITTD